LEAEAEMLQVEVEVETYNAQCIAVTFINLKIESLLLQLFDLNC
jgi:hypothetical protein